jgi:hypothetical protein
VSLLIQKWAAETVSLSIQASRSKLCQCRFRNWQQNCGAADSEIGSQNVSLPIQKSAMKHCVAVDSEIDSENCGAADSGIESQTVSVPIQKLTAKLRRCRFRNRQPKCVAADSEISNEKLCRCRFRNRQRWCNHFWLYCFWCLQKLSRC